MLVLSRRESEKIMIGDSIVITVVRTGGDKVRIGVEAPDNVLILRGELEVHNKGCHERKHEEPLPQRVSKPAA